MRLVFTAVDPRRRARTDVVLQAEPDLPVGQVLARLADLLQSGTGNHGAAEVVDLRGVRADRGGAAREPVVVYVDGSALDPKVPLAQSPLREGSVASLGDPAGCPDREPDGLVEVRVAGGPGAGEVHRLGIGSFTIGSGVDAHIRLCDGDVPARVARLEVSPDGDVLIRPEEQAVDASGMRRPSDPEAGPVVVPDREDPKDAPVEVDTDRAMAVLELDRAPLREDTDWPAESVLSVGTVLLSLHPTERPDASLSPSPNGATVDFNRPPRLLPPERHTTFSMPTEPQRPHRQAFPLAMMALPMVGAVLMVLILDRVVYLLFGLLSPLMYLGQYLTNRRHGKRTFREQMQRYRERKANVEQAARQALRTERAARRRGLPDPASLLLFASGPRARLWERRPSDPDWLTLRVGTADLPSEVTVEDPSREAHERKTTWYAPDVPANVSLLDAGVVGVAGPDGVARGLGGWALGQLAALHSPADLRLVVLDARSGGDDWAWVRWLPHTRGDEDDDHLVHVGFDDDTIRRRIAELSRIVEARQERLSDRRTRSAAEPFEQVVVVMDGARRLRLLPGVVGLLKDGPEVGVRFICLDADERQLPDEARAVVSAHGAWLRLRRTASTTVDGVRPDLVSTTWCERLARALSPIRDVSGDEEAAAVPDSSRLLSLLHLDPPDPRRLLAGWQAGGRTTRAVIGECADGVFRVDVSRDGPHALVAGTTGAGKSELLQSMIASLAIGNRPDEMTFVLVDYKGGAAFKDCSRLPHTVGMVTDLDGHLTTRALESLAAELRRRERVLARADAKDIEEYQQHKRDDDEPLPRLMIVIDEFAALVAELPDFVHGLVDIARRGRSLGVHLVLATQRPAGVVSNDIKSNTNMRIALRVTDQQDSGDVVDAPDAAFIAKSTPGRAYARLGHSSLVAFQTARVGGRPPGESAHDLEMRSLVWPDFARAVRLGRPGAGDEDSGVPSDLALLVGALDDTARASGIAAPPSPWLPPLPDVTTLEDLRLPQPATDGSVAPLPFGLSDVPREQRRDVAAYAVETAGHLGVVGAPRTGRSTALRAVAAAVGRSTSPADVHLYGLDCGNNALLPLVGLPHTGAVVIRDQVERVSRLTARLQAEIGRRQQLLAEQGYADVREQRRAVEGDDRLPYLLVLLDRWEGFVAAYDGIDAGRLVDAWMQILQEGAAVGVKVVLTGDRSMLVGRISTLVDEHLLLRMTDPSDFTAIGMKGKDVPSHMPAGRGFRSSGLRETQVALLAPDPEGTAQVAALQQIGREAERRFGPVPPARRPFRVDPLPVSIEYKSALALAERPLPAGQVLVGVGGDELSVRTFDALEHGPALVIAGPPRSGRSTALLTMWTSMRDAGWSGVVVVPRRSPLRDLEGERGVQAVFDGQAERGALEEALAGLAALPGRKALLVDDLELLGQDGPAADVVTATVAAWRDSGNLVVTAGTLDDLTGMYRGPITAVKRSRAGLLLNPQGFNAGDLLGLKLPRSMTTGTAPLGRGVLVTAGAWELVQVARP
jgi:DNA segregation ATPase FtsK/SpoIIIE, S-DNA-T family